MSASEAMFECESQTALPPATRKRSCKAYAISASVLACAVLGVGLIAAERYGIVHYSVIKSVGAHSQPGKTLDPTKLAFVSFVPAVSAHRAQLRAAASPKSPIWPTVPRRSSSRHAVPTANLVERAARLAKANANQLMSKFEDPEKLLEQAVQDMQGDLIKVRQSYAEVSASQKKMKAQIQSAEAEAAKWYSRAQLAIERGEDELAREALTRRQAQQETATNLAQQVETQEALTANLYESMKQLESKMAEAKAKKDQIIARAKVAKAATNVNDMLAGIGTGSSTAAFERMTEKVEMLEATAEVSSQLAASSPSNLLTGSSGGGTSLDAKFKALEGGDSIEDELAAMKRGLALPPGKMPEAIESAEAKKE